MNLSHLWMLNLLWLLPLAAVVLIFQSRKKKRALQGYADAHLLARLAAHHHRGPRFIKAMLLLLSLGLMLFALAGPRWGSHYEEVSQKGVDIMLLIDVSTSMWVEDISPNRLERARREILDFIKVVQGDRVGLLAFAGAAFIQCPLTLDYAALEMFLSALQPDLIPFPGTDLGAAIDVGVSAFDDESATDKVIMLITDGEDNENRGIRAARQAAANGVKIYVFGIGDVGGGPIPELDGSGGFKKDPQGNLILSKLEEEGQRDIAAMTGGTYVRSVAGDLDLDALYFDGIKSHTRAQELKSGKIKVYEERFALFVLAAFVLLLVEGFVDKSVRLKTGAGRKAAPARAKVLLLTALSACILAAADARADESPVELYRQGRFAEAEKAYAQSGIDHPKDLRYRYNKGVAAYQKGDYQGAASAFRSVLRRKPDKDLSAKVLYNLGNAEFMQGKYNSALENYRKALRQDPTSEDIQHNLDLSGRMVQLVENPPEPPPGDPSQKDPSDGEKKEGDQKQPSGNRPSDKKSAKKQEKNQSEQSDENSYEENSADRQQPGQKPRQDLAGELKPRGDMSADQADEQTDEANIIRMNQKKAEALLDNIQEDRSRMMRRQTKVLRQRVQSGKDW